MATARAYGGLSWRKRVDSSELSPENCSSSRERLISAERCDANGNRKRLWRRARPDSSKLSPENCSSVWEGRRRTRWPIAIYEPIFADPRFPCVF